MTQRLVSASIVLFSLLPFVACTPDDRVPVLLDGGSGSPGQPDALALQGVVIDDFEDGDVDGAIVGSAWYAYDDKSNQGNSRIGFTGAPDGGVAMNGPGYQSERSLEVDFTFDKAALPYQPYVGWGIFLAQKAAPFDASTYVGIAYTYRGAAHRVRVETFDVTDYDFFGMEMSATSEWKTVVVPFRQLSQVGWGKTVSFNAQNIGQISFEARGDTGVQGMVALDDLMFLNALPDQPPDMSVLPAQPPAEDPIPSVTISNPLQAKAMRYLTRGYNITNWLEEKRFAGFTYDQTYVNHLAAAGFQSLRLPVDLDMYVVSSTGTGDATEVVLHDDLFVVLDAFVDWTAQAGLSLTIDYHQYTSLLDKSKPETLDRAVACWRKVAEHYATSSREDLFYELLNEPELSFTGTTLTDAEWTALAERMIKAIRASDTTHTLLFGDTNYYSIGSLSNRQPLSDANVIYVFHDYEPFIFTHQGADWASMASTHDIPYPYSPERWSPYFGDLGFTESMPSWILSAARGYYATGNHAWVRNPIVKVKKWGVAHNVPVICNEFGVYDRSARLEDRARYLADVISIFEELEIPWQQWFLIMDKNGTVVPEYREALHLNR